ncbi:MAG: hypothetical protein LBL65_05645 [Campylobacteraceae bacterium]|jgi:hypothetical protein|nr:hypothetical protein [Campylobacteraceae bacterium]
MDSRLSKLLKTKKYENMSMEELIDEYIRLYVSETTQSLDNLFDELLIFMNRYDNKLTREQIEELFIARAANVATLPKSSILIPLIYEKSLNTLKAKFSFTNEKAIQAISQKLLWTKENSDERTVNKLREIFADVYRGKYTHEKLMDKLREEFEDYKNLELHKLAAAADLSLRQGRNLGIVSRALENEDEYLQVVAVIDDKTTNICRSMHLRVIKTGDIEKQYNNLINAKNVDEAKTASNLNYANKGVWAKKLPANFGIPPYHFGCRTILRQMSSIQIKEMMLDEFGREYEINEEVLEKIEFKHLWETKYNTPEELIRKTMSSIEKEGVHINDPRKRTIWGRNGVLVILSEHGEIETAYKPSAGLRAYLNTTGEIYYNEVRKSLLERVIKWVQES